MHDLALIIALMRENTDALGFIPSTAIAARWIRQGRYLIQRDRHNKRCGYLLHGPIHADGTMHINQVCLALDRRRRRYATALLDQLKARARAAGATTLLLRCAADLEAIHFWRASLAEPGPLLAGGIRRSRLIQPFRIPILAKPVPQFRSYGPFDAALDPKHLHSNRPLDAA